MRIEPALGRIPVRGEWVETLDGGDYRIAAVNVATPKARAGHRYVVLADMYTIRIDRLVYVSNGLWREI